MYADLIVIIKMSFFLFKALAQKGLPPNAKRAWKSLLDLANDAWITIGDTATDVNKSFEYQILQICLCRLNGIQNDFQLRQSIEVRRFICFKINHRRKSRQ